MLPDSPQESPMSRTGLFRFTGVFETLQAVSPVSSSGLPTFQAWLGTARDCRLPTAIEKTQDPHLIHYQLDPICPPRMLRILFSVSHFSKTSTSLQKTCPGLLTCGWQVISPANSLTGCCFSCNLTAWTNTSESVEGTP